MTQTYKRKTNNPNLGWSEERKSAWSARIRADMAAGKWFKKPVVSAKTNSLNTTLGQDLQNFLDKLESVLGVKMTMKEFIEQAIKDKMSEISSTFQKRA